MVGGSTLMDNLPPGGATQRTAMPPPTPAVDNLHRAHIARTVCTRAAKSDSITLAR